MNAISIITNPVLVAFISLSLCAPKSLASTIRVQKSQYPSSSSTGLEYVHHTKNNQLLTAGFAINEYTPFNQDLLDKDHPAAMLMRSELTIGVEIIEKTTDLTNISTDFGLGYLGGLQEEAVIRSGLSIHKRLSLESTTSIKASSFLFISERLGLDEGNADKYSKGIGVSVSVGL